MLLLRLCLESRDFEAKTVMLQTLLLSSRPPEEHINLWRREVKCRAMELQLCRCQVKRGILEIWNVKATLTRSLAFLIIASMTEILCPPATVAGMLENSWTTSTPLPVKVTTYLKRPHNAQDTQMLQWICSDCCEAIYNCNIQIMSNTSEKIHCRIGHERSNLRLSFDMKMLLSPHTKNLRFLFSQQDCFSLKQTTLTHIVHLSLTTKLPAIKCLSLSLSHSHLSFEKLVVFLERKVYIQCFWP